MDFGYLVCSSLRCDTEHFVYSDDGIDDDIVVRSTSEHDPPHPYHHQHQHQHPGAVESTHSGFSFVSEQEQEQRQAESTAASNASSCSVDASSNSNSNTNSNTNSRRKSSGKKLQSGHTSPSSLALQRRPPEPSVYLKQQTLSTDISLTSADNSTGAGSSSFSSFSNNRVRNNNNNSNNNNNNNNTMGIPSNNSNPSQTGTSGLENGVQNIFVSTPKSANVVTTNGGNPKKATPPRREGERERERERKREEHPGAGYGYQQFCLDPPALRSKAWSEPSAEEYRVRSKTYLSNGIKELSEPSAFRLIAVDLVNTATPIYTGMCAHPGERVQSALERERETGVRELPEFVFAVNLCIPGDRIYHAVFYYGIDKATMDEIKNGQTPFGRIMNKFMFGESDAFRNNAFKLIPRIVEGNYVVRKGVGTKPAILGKKIKQYFIRGGGGASGTTNNDGDEDDYDNDNDNDRYFEIIVDIASDPVAKRITKLCLGCIKTIVVDMMFALEGYDESTLPERIFGGATIKNLDFKTMDGKRTVR